MNICGDYWCELGTSNIVDSNLITRTSSTVVPIGTASLLSGNCTVFVRRVTTGGYYSLSNCLFNEATQLYYIPRQSSRSHPEAKSFCEARNMRLIETDETIKGLSNGIRCYNDYNSCWTNSYYDSGMPYVLDTYNGGRLYGSASKNGNKPLCVIEK